MYDEKHKNLLQCILVFACVFFSNCGHEVYLKYCIPTSCIGRHLLCVISKYTSLFVEGYKTLEILFYVCVFLSDFHILNIILLKTDCVLTYLSFYISVWFIAISLLEKKIILKIVFIWIFFFSFLSSDSSSFCKIFCERLTKIDSYRIAGMILILL